MFRRLIALGFGLAAFALAIPARSQTPDPSSAPIRVTVSINADGTPHHL